MNDSLQKSGLKQGPISESDFMRNLVNAKKIMKKTDSGDFTRGHINESILTSDPDEIANDTELMKTIKEPKVEQMHQQPIMDIERIKNSKLPDAIKEAMINNPTTNLSLNDNTGVDLFAQARRLMEEENLVDKPKQQVRSFTSQRQPKQQVNEQQNIPQGSFLVNETTLALMVENSVRKILDEVFDKKLNQILMAQDSKTINENVAIKVGDTIFSGKITKQRSSKK